MILAIVILQAEQERNTLRRATERGIFKNAEEAQQRFGFLTLGLSSGRH